MNAAENLHRGHAQRFIHVEHASDLRVEFRLRQRHHLAEAHQPGVIVTAVRRPDVERRAVLLLVAEVGEVRADVPLMRRGQLRGFRIRRRDERVRLVGHVHVEDRSVLRILLLDEPAAITRQLQNRSARVHRARRDEVAQVAVRNRNSRAMEHVENVDFILRPHRRAASRTIDADVVLYATKQTALGEIDVVTDILVAVPNAAGDGSLQLRAGVVEDFRTIVDQRRAVARVAHHVGIREHEVAVGIQHDQPQLMRGKRGALRVGHLVERTRVRPLHRRER